ncbi:MAG: DUF2017 domain-containing protein [Propionibacteriaceae bacterium]|nr:DUF2017 domain-containing protein [Propionibacteriaceae bacterium]
MPAFSRRDSTLQTLFDSDELTVLGMLVGELIELLSPLCPHTSDEIFTEPPPFWRQDPALNRLFPDAYADDEAASAEFSRYTMADQTLAKTDAANLVLTDLGAAEDGLVSVPPDHIEAWLITLTNLRLVLAERMGIDNIAEANSMDHPTAAVYTWCGLILDSMVQLL